MDLELVISLGYLPPELPWGYSAHVPTGWRVGCMKMGMGRWDLHAESREEPRGRPVSWMQVIPLFQLEYLLYLLQFPS